MAFDLKSKAKEINVQANLEEKFSTLSDMSQGELIALICQMGVSPKKKKTKKGRSRWEDSSSRESLPESDDSKSTASSDEENAGSSDGTGNG